jgi:hypothetical protein
MAGERDGKSNQPLSGQVEQHPERSDAAGGQLLGAFANPAGKVVLRSHSPLIMRQLPQFV